MQFDTLPTKLKSLENKPLYALIWTTTPWSLVANQAIAFSKDVVYCVVEDNSKNLYVVAQECVTSIERRFGPLKSITTIKGKKYPLVESYARKRAVIASDNSLTGHELIEARYLHPITKERLPFLPGQHVTTSIGTGLVHTAPAHGPEDFLIAIDNNISVVSYFFFSPTIHLERFAIYINHWLQLSLVDEEGCFTVDTGDKFAGLNVLTDGADKVLDHIGPDVLHTDVITHSYPYDWRTKKPVIIRASHQWFIDINSIKQKAIVSRSDILPKRPVSRSRAY